MKHYLVPILAAAALAGCAQPTLRGDTATTVVTVTNRSNPAYFAAAAYHDDYDCYGRQVMAVMGDGQRDHVVPLPAKANQSIWFSYLNVEPMVVKSCTGVVTIPTKEGAQYRLEFIRTTSGCEVEAFERLNWTETRIPVVMRELSRPLGSNQGPWCAADKRYLGSSVLATPRTEGEQQ